jgi:MYXO-CTERM domain-containing protein
MLSRSFAVFASSFALSVLLPGAAAAGGPPHAASVVRVLGPSAERIFAPVSGQIGALVAVPPGQRAEDLGLSPVVPGIARLRGSGAELLAFTSAHPGLHVEIAPPLHPLLDNAGKWVQADIGRFLKNVDGTGVLVGVADTGLDVTHPDFIDEKGNTRVAWMLDLSLAPRGNHPDLEQKFGISQNGAIVSGAVFNADEINVILSNHEKAPTDEIGHGTHVSSIAAGNGGIKPHSPYVGMAPGANIVFVRVTRDASESIENDDLVRAVQFIFDRADFEKKPVSVNLSLGSDFGPHDGSFLWESALASFVGPDKPGHALVVAAGNSGSISETPIHQSVHVARSSTLRVPITTSGAANGSIQVWIAMREGASLSVGLDGPDGSWISPVSDGNEGGKNSSGYNAGVVNGSTAQNGNGPVPKGSHGAVALWQGAWPTGQYEIVLEGEGTADLYLQGGGDAAPGGASPASFVAGVREGTINLPATHPSIIAVGCTVNRVNWTSIDKAEVALHVPLLDARGGAPLAGNPTRNLADGEVCWFSSAGPTVTGQPKPEISSPGGLVVAAMSAQALPGSPGSVFTNPSCPPLKKGGTPDPKCLQIDANHGVAVGTSMSAPLVAGAVALLFQVDPTLTQDKVVALLQAGAHPFRGAAPFEDQGGPGELDIRGSLDALDRMHDPQAFQPSLGQSWITLSADYVAADGSTPLTAIVELRTDDGQHRADLLGDRLQAVVKLDGVPTLPPTILRRAPGVYTFVVQPPAGFGGQSLTLGATFDGADIVTPKTVPIAADVWASQYPSTATGGCAVAPPPRGGAGLGWLALGLGAALVRRRRR